MRVMSHYAGWSEDRINAAKKLFLEGKSASEIAAALGGGLTRCAVIGKPHRMGWTSTHRQAPTSTGKVRAPNLKGHRPAPPKPGPQNRPGAVFGAVTVENAAETERKRALHRAEGEALVAAMSGPANDDAILLIDRRTV